MNVESLWIGLAIATTFLSLPHSSRFWLEFVMSDFKRAKAFDVKPMIFESFCLKIRLTLTLVWIFEANWLVWLWESHPITLFLFPSLSQVLGEWLYLQCRKVGGKRLFWNFQMNNHQLLPSSVYVVFAFISPFLSFTRLLIFFHYETVLFL